MFKGISIIALAFLLLPAHAYEVSTHAQTRLEFRPTLPKLLPVLHLAELHALNLSTTRLSGILDGDVGGIATRATARPRLKRYGYG